MLKYVNRLMIPESCRSKNTIFDIAFDILVEEFLADFLSGNDAILAEL